MTIDPRVDTALQALILELAANVRGSLMTSARFATTEALAVKGAIRRSFVVELSDEFGPFTASIQDFGSGIAALSIVDVKSDKEHTTVYELTIDETTGDYRSRIAIDRLAATEPVEQRTVSVADLWAVPEPPAPDEPSDDVLETFTLSLQRLASVSLAFARLLSIRDDSAELELDHLFVGLFANRSTHASTALASCRMRLGNQDATAIAALPLASSFDALGLDELNTRLRDSGFDRPAPPPSQRVRQALAHTLDAAEPDAELCTGDILRGLLLFDLAHNGARVFDRYVPASPAELWAALDRTDCSED